MKPLPLSLLCLSIGIACFLAGRLTLPPDNSPSGGKDKAADASSGRASQRGDAGAERRNPAAEARGPGGFTGAMKGALGHTLEIKRLERWMALLGTMRPEDAPAIASLLQEEQLAGRAFPAETTAFWQTWASLDAKAAWTFIQANVETAGERGTTPLMKAWAFIDPEAASEAFKQLGDSPLAEAALSGLTHGLAESNPATAVAFASSLPEGRQIQAAVHASGSIIYMMGNDGAKSWFDALPATSPIFNKEAARVLMESLSRSNPGSVEEFAMARLDQQWASRPAEQNFAASMILRNGGSPWEYVTTTMETHPNEENPLALARWVANMNPGSAIQWVDEHPDHAAADKILAGAAQALLQKGKQAEAQALLDRIRQPEVRDLVELP